VLPFCKGGNDEKHVYGISDIMVLKITPHEMLQQAKPLIV
jgi:hypothetical protein